MSNLTSDGGIKAGHCILTGRENCAIDCLHITAKRSVGKWLKEDLGQILLPAVHDRQIDRQHPAILEESPQVLFGMITAMTSPKSWEAIIQGHEVRFLTHEAWNGPLKESVEKDAFIASGKKKVKKQSGEDPVVHEVERVCGLVEAIGHIIQQTNHIPHLFN